MRRAWAPVMALLGWGLMAVLCWHLLQWAVVHAVWQPDATACQNSPHGACWGVVPAKALPILLGHYPEDQRWRPLLFMLASMACLWAFARARADRRLGWWLLCGAVWLPVAILLLRGGWGPLSLVPPTDWGGLPLTLMLFLGSWWLSVPLGIMLAVARHQGGLAGWLATGAIELIRGVPLITLLFASVFALPLLLPTDHTPPLVLRAALALVLFSAVYLAEVVRGGLQTVPPEQAEAGKVLGLGYWGIQRRIVLPQALRSVLPGLTGHAIGLLKDTSLVVVVGVHELTGGLSLVMSGDPVWRPHHFEAYLFVGLIYALLCLGLSLGGRRLERRWLDEKKARLRRA